MRELVVVGASLAGLRAVEAARRAGFDGRVTLVGSEPHLPYNRPPLSKEFLAGGLVAADLWLTTEDKLAALDIDLLLGEPADGLDLDAREVVIGSRRLPYEGLVIATGAQPRRLPDALGGNLDGVHVLRTVEDAEALRAELVPGARVVVIGAGFIGAEVASSARTRGCEVTVLEALATPLARGLGPTIGGACGSLHATNGTDLRCEATVASLAGSERVEGVVLADGTELAADVVVVGVGVGPATGWLAGSGLNLADGLVCDATLCAGAPGVYAAGDVVRWEHSSFGSLRLESWTGAAEQASLAIGNLLDPATAKPCALVPYFWSDQYGVKIQCLGVPAPDEVAVVHGSIEEGKLLALYRDGDRLGGAAAIDCPHLIMKLRQPILRGSTWPEALDFCAAW